MAFLLVVAGWRGCVSVGGVSSNAALHSQSHCGVAGESPFDHPTHTEVAAGIRAGITTARVVHKEGCSQDLPVCLLEYNKDTVDCMVIDTP